MSRTVQIQSIALCQNQVPCPLGLPEAAGTSGGSRDFKVLERTDGPLGFVRRS